MLTSSAIDSARHPLSPSARCLLREWARPASYSGAAATARFPYPRVVRVSVLGATEAWRGEQRLLLGSRKRRALVAALALSGGRPVSVDALVDLLWGDSPPDGVAGTLQVYVSGLRRVIEPERAPRAPATVLVTVEPGYALALSEDDLDAARFDRAVSESHRLLSASAAPAGARRTGVGPGGCRRGRPACRDGEPGRGARPVARYAVRRARGGARGGGRACPARGAPNGRAGGSGCGRAGVG